MLLSFRAANVLSLRDEQTLSFVATELNDGSARSTRIREGGKRISAVPVVGIYGANASGKTKVLEALMMMRSAVLRSADWFMESAPVRRVPFLLDEALAREPSFSRSIWTWAGPGTRTASSWTTNWYAVSGCTPIRAVAVRCGSSGTTTVKSPSPARACAVRS